MAEVKLTGTITKERTLTGSINKGIGMGELPQARGLREFLSPAYSVNGADLTAVSEAISEKAGVEKPAWPDGWKEAVEGIEVGEEFPESKLYCTLTAEMSWKEIVEANPITPRYKHGLIWMVVMGDNVATQGTTTYKWLYIFHNGDGEGIALNARFFISYNYKNALVSPNSMYPSNSVAGANGGYVTEKNGVITGLNRPTHYVAAGNSIYLQEIPFDILNCRMDTTKWGES